VIYTNFFIPESYQYVHAQHQQHQQSSHEPIRWLEKINIFSALQILFRERPKHMTRYALPWIALAEFLLTLVKRPPIFLYAMLKFHWTAYEGSLYFSCASLMRLLMMVGVLPLLHKLFNNNKTPEDNMSKSATTATTTRKTSISFDIWMVRIGIGIDAISLALVGLATSVVLFTMAGMLQSVSMLAQPSIRGLVTNLVQPNQVGELLGAVAILDSIASKFCTPSMVLKALVTFFCSDYSPFGRKHNL
jgi:hypothetical protein